MIHFLLHPGHGPRRAWMVLNHDMSKTAGESFLVTSGHTTVWWARQEVLVDGARIALDRQPQGYRRTADTPDPKGKS